jgi:multiple sugar transport system permease protein
VKVLRRAGVYFTVLPFCFFAAAPFLWMLITTFKQDRDLYRAQNNPFLFNDPPTLDNLRLLLFETNYLSFVRNSAVVGLLVVLITLAVALPAGYSLARLIGKWGERAGIGMFLIYLVPPTLLFIPMFRVVVALGLRTLSGRWW